MRSRSVSARAGLIVAIALVPTPLWASSSALRKLTKGDTVEVEGKWDRKAGVFLATKIEKLSKPRHPSVRGVIEAWDRGSGMMMIFRREVRVGGETTFISSSGQEGGGLLSLRPGMRVEVTAVVGESGAWTATKVVWEGVKASAKVKGTITEVYPVDRAEETIEISGLPLRVTERTDLRTDYLERELLDGLFVDVGEANAPHTRLGQHLLFSGDVRPSVRRETGYSLSGSDDGRTSAEPAMTVQLAGHWGYQLQGLLDMRLGNTYSWEGERFDVLEPRVEARQAYAVLRIPGDRGAALVVGKQRVRDRREWLFDEYLDGVRLYVYGTRPLVLEASYFPSVLAGKNEKFATWDDLLLRARYIPDSRNEASFYFLKRSDSSPRRREPVYWGLSYQGRPRRNLAGWLEASLLRGEDKGRPQKAWAVDVGATLSARGQVRPSLTLAYAIGSGEKKEPGDPFSQEFRQTGYEDNSDRFGGFANFRYYGEVLDPELSNLKILTLGAGLRFGYSVSVEGVFHTYRQQQLHEELRSHLAPKLNKRSPELGHEADVILAVQNLWKRVNLAYTFGRFDPGAAFTGTPGPLTLHRLSVRLAF